MISEDVQGEKSPEMKLMEWIYETDRGYLHLAWFTRIGFLSITKTPFFSWLETNHPTIYNEYLNYERKV